MTSSSSIIKKDPFTFIHRIGADSSMLDYAKMSILFAFQPKYKTFYKSCEFIQENLMKDIKELGEL